MKDPKNDGVLVVLTPQDMTNPAQTAEALKPYAKGLGKPLLASWMGGSRSCSHGEQILSRAGIPTYQFPDSAARAFALRCGTTPTTCARIYETCGADDGNRSTARPTIAIATSQSESHRAHAFARRRANDPHRIRIRSGCWRRTAFPTVVTRRRT